METAQEKQGQSISVRGRSICEGLHQGTIRNIPETERPVENCCLPWESNWLFQRGYCLRLPKHLHPLQPFSAPGHDSCPLYWWPVFQWKTCQVGCLSRVSPNHPTMRWSLEQFLAYSFSFILTLCVLLSENFTWVQESKTVPLYIWNVQRFTEPVLIDSFFSTGSCQIVRIKF